MYADTITDSMRAAGMPEGKSGRLRGPWHIPYGKGLDYYDAVNHIRRAKCPVEITRAGLGDYTCPPSGLALYYNAVPGKKSISWVQGSEHGHVPPNYEGRDFKFEK